MTTKIPVELSSTPGIVDGSNATAITITSDEKVGIGETSPANLLHVKASDVSAAPIDTALMVLEKSGTNYLSFMGANTNTQGVLFGDADDNDVAGITYNHSSNYMAFNTLATERMRIDSSGNLKFNSGFGSVGTAYGVRAWVNFDGTGTVSIRENGNVSSITDHATGQYTCNFSSAMPDGDYVICGSAGHTSHSNQISVTQNRGATAPATSSCRISVTYGNMYLIDVGQVTVAFIR